MRGCLFTLVLGAAVIAGLVVLVLPRAVEGLIAASLSSGGLEARQTDVSLTTSSPTDLLGLRAATVTIRATDARIGGMDAARVDLVLGDVDLRARTARTLSGTIEGAVIETPDGPVVIPTIGLDGDTSEITAVASVDGPSVEALVAARVETATGEAPSDVTLAAPNVLTISLGGLPVPGTLLVDESGALRLSLAAPLSVDVELLAPGVTALDLAAVRIAGDRLVLEGAFDPAVLG